VNKCFLQENLTERDHKENMDGGGRIILKIYDGRFGVDSSGSRIGTSGGLL
jgi:hypothetical protein